MEEWFLVFGLLALILDSYRRQRRKRGVKNEECRMMQRGRVKCRFLNADCGLRGGRQEGGNPPNIPVRSSVAAFYRWIMSFEPSGHSSGGRMSRPVGR